VKLIQEVLLGLTHEGRALKVKQRVTELDASEEKCCKPLLKYL
jgi:hypothetical protein